MTALLDRKMLTVVCRVWWLEMIVSDEGSASWVISDLTISKPIPPPFRFPPHYFSNFETSLKNCFRDILSTYPVIHSLETLFLQRVLTFFIILTNLKFFRLPWGLSLCKSVSFDCSQPKTSKYITVSYACLNVIGSDYFSYFWYEESYFWKQKYPRWWCCKRFQFCLNSWALNVVFVLQISFHSWVIYMQTI